MKFLKVKYPLRRAPVGEAWRHMLDIRKAGHTLQGLVELLGAE